MVLLHQRNIYRSCEGSLQRKNVAVRNLSLFAQIKRFFGGKHPHIEPLFFHAFKRRKLLAARRQQDISRKRLQQSCRLLCILHPVTVTADL